MRFLIWLSLFLWVLPPAVAQDGGRLAFKQFTDLRSTTTLMVLYDDAPTYNEALRRAVEGHWTLTPTLFIAEKDLPRYANDAQYSMLVRDNSEKSHTRVTGTTLIRRSHLALYVCGRGPKLIHYGGKDAVAQFQLPDVMDAAAYDAKLPALIRAMHSYLGFLDREKITEDNHGRKLDFFRNAQAGKIGNMTLYILAPDLPDAMRAPEQLLAAYPHDFEIVTAEALRQVVAEGRPDVAIFHPTPKGEDIYVISLTGEILYHAHPGMRERVQVQDFTQISNRIANPPEAELTLMEKLRRLLGKKKNTEG